MTSSDVQLALAAIDESIGGPSAPGLPRFARNPGLSPTYSYPAAESLVSRGLIECREALQGYPAEDLLRIYLGVLDGNPHERARAYRLAEYLLTQWSTSLKRDLEALPVPPSPSIALLKQRMLRTHQALLGVAQILHRLNVLACDSNRHRLND